jgi:hypothetical protein
MAEAPLPVRSSRSALSLLGVFALGIVFGAALTVVVSHARELHRPFGHHGPGDGLPPHAERLIRNFGLDPDQETKVRAILAKSRDDIHGILDGAHEEIRSLLRPEQQEKLDSMKEFRGHRRRRGPADH